MGFDSPPYQERLNMSKFKEKLYKIDTRIAQCEKWQQKYGPKCVEGLKEHYHRKRVELVDKIGRK